MDASVSLVGDEAGDELRRLTQWLRDDEDLRNATIVVKEASGQPGDMGPGTDLIQVAFQQHGVLVALVGVLGTWVGTRRRNVKIRVRVGKKEVEIDGAQPKDAEEVAARLLQELGEYD